MRIFDIINEGPLPAITNPDEISDYQNLINRDRPIGHGISHAGSGADAKVFKTDKHPEVLKVMTIEQHLKNNPYLQYVLMSKRYAHENPFLPRIISIQTAGSVTKPSRHDGDKIQDMYVVKMEPLVDTIVLSDKEVDFMYEHTFGRPSRMSAYAIGSDVLVDNMVEILNDIAYAELSHHVLAEYNIKNKHLIAVMRLIVKIKNQVPGSRYDFHAGNIMARRTPYGTQLVIIDPLHSVRNDINR